MWHAASGSGRANPHPCFEIRPVCNRHYVTRPYSHARANDAATPSRSSKVSRPARVNTGSDRGDFAFATMCRARLSTLRRADSEENELTVVNCV